MLTRKLSAETPELSSVAAECRRTGEPVCVTENGRPAFVMMDMLPLKPVKRGFQRVKPLWP